MSDLLQKGNAWQQAQREKSVSHPVAYHRGADSATINATVGETLWDVENAGGVQVEGQSRDYLITVANLIIGGETITPKAGDRIFETLAGETVIFEVAAPFDEPAWRYHDNDRLTFRIHTTAVDSE